MSTQVLPSTSGEAGRDELEQASAVSTQLTSFGFLPEECDEGEAPFAFGQLFSKVKSAFTSVAVASSSTPTETAPPTAATSNDAGSVTNSSHNALSRSPETSQLHVRKGSRNLNLSPGSHELPSSVPSRSHSTSPTNARQPSRAASGASSAQPPQRSGSSRVGSGVAASSKAAHGGSGPSGAPSLATSMITGTSSGFPFKLSGTARAAAPAVTSTAAAHAITARYTTAATTDGSSAAGDDGEVDGDGDVLSALMRKSGVAMRRGGAGLGGGGAAAWSSIPGFPLSRDLLADDARSIRSTSSRQPRSELNSEAHIPTSFAAHAHAFGHTERAGLTTSAEAFRRMRGEGGLSKQFWMPDESVTECRGCGSAFTPFRRKHHCRLDGLIYCGRCAPAIVSGRRFGLADEPVRICTFCMRMLAEYDRAGEGHHQPNQRTRNTSLTGSILGAPMRQAAAAVASVGGSGSTVTVAPPRTDKGMISGPLEAQNKTPQSQFAASHLFSSRPRAVPTSLSMSKVAETSFDSIAVGGSRPTSPDRAMSTSPAASRTKKEGGTAAPFRMGLGDEDKAFDRAHEEEEEEEEAHHRERNEVGRSHGVPPRQHSPDAPATTGANIPAIATSSDTLLAPTPVRPPLKTATSSATDVSSVGFPRTEPSSRGESPPPKLARNLSDSRNRLMSEGADARTRLVSDAARKAFRRSRLRTKTTLGGDEGDVAARDGAVASDGLGGGLPTSPGDEDLLRLLSHSRRPSSYAGGLQHHLHHHNGARGPQLGVTSLAHLESMLEQCLRNASIPQPDVWKEVLLNLVLTAVKNLKPTDEAGSSMDVRHLVKVKRIVGGSPRDSQHVLGVVVSKNVATKRMAKALPLSSPRILVLAFPIDFYRASGSFLSLDRVEKEQEYTRLLVGRIAQLRPNVVIVKDSVSRMAIDMLEDAGITVVWSLKPSAIEAITRACDADVITSVDRLALEPRLGRCLSLSVDTFEHAALPSARKSYMRFLAPFGIRNPGCTIILRGGDTALLARIKAMVELLVFVAHNLRLEEYLAQDEAVSVKELHDTQVLPLLQEEDELWTSILDALRPFENTVLTATATIKVPPPFPLVRLKADHLRLTELARQTREAQPELSQASRNSLLTVHATVGEEKESTTPSATTPSTEVPPAVDSESGSADATPLAEVPSTRFDQLAGPPPASAVAAPPPTSTPDPIDVPMAKKKDDGRTKENSGTSANGSGNVTASSSAALSEKMILAALGDGMAVPSGLAEALQPGNAAATKPSKSEEKAPTGGPSNATAVAPLAQEEVPAELEAVLPLRSDMERETAYRAIKMAHDEHASAWASYLEPDRPAPSPFMFQRLVFLTSTISSNTRRPCTGPTLKTIEHYGANDEPLGRHLERLCAESSVICGAKGCGRPKGVQHFSVYVHNDVRVLIVQERFVCPIPGQEGRLLMWNYCKVCEQASPVVPVSPETLCLSFAKYLEGHFYPTAKTTPCQHDYHRDHVRFFALQNLAIRFHTDPVDVREVIFPQQRLVVWPDSDAALKRDEACTMAKRMRRYFDSVLARLAALRTETYVCRESATAASQAANVDAASQRAQGEWQTLLSMLVELVATTAPTDVLALNSIRRRVQEAVVRWDRDFAELEKAILPPERDMRRLTASHLSRLFAESNPGERGVDVPPLPPASEVDEAGSTSEKGGDGTGALDSASASAAHSGTATPLTSDHALATPVVEGGSTIKARLPGSGNDVPLIPASFSSRSDISVTADGLPSPAAWRQRRLTQSSAMAAASGVEDSSCTETDAEATNLVSRLVRRFDSPQRMTPAKAAAIHSPPSHSHSNSQTLSRPQSPVLRRALPAPSPRHPQKPQPQAQRSGQAQTGSKPAQSKLPVRPPMKRITSDGGVDTRPPADAAAMSTADERECLMSDDETRKRTILSSEGETTRSVIRRLRPAPRQSNPPTTPTALTPGGPSQGSRLAPPRPGLRRGPPSSYRPPRLSESEADGQAQSRSRHGSVSSLSRGSAHRAGSESEDKGGTSGARKGTLRKTSSNSRLRGGKAPAIPVSSAARPKVSTIAKHFDRIHRDAEKEREKQRQLMAIRARRAQPIAAARAKVEVFSSVREAVKDDDDDDDDDDEEESVAEAGKTSSGDEAEDEADSDAERAALVCAASQDSRSDAPLANAGAGRVPGLTNAESSKAVQQGGSGTATPMEARERPRGASNAAEATLSAISNTLSSSWRSSLMPEVEGSERGSLLKALSSLWGRGRALPLLEYPQGANEHLFADSRVVLREDEPSSLIAFTLSSSAYQHRLDSLRAAHAKIEERLEEFQPNDPDSSTLSSWDIVDVSETAALESALRRPEGTHLRFDFESGGSRFNIRTLYTEQFDALRRACGCEQSFITSLSRCVRWDSSGGKSGAAFLKTKDDRLVIKQLSRAEMEAFSSNASSYFRYMAESIFAGRPSTLAKIFGCYRIYIRNAQSGKTIKMDCIVMEHLFYGRRMSRLFDLKGSLRNRHIRETGRADEVLQDENLVEMSGLKPLFVREHSKRLLRAALWNDSLFLSEMNVMDYSLVVGLDADRDEMVVGIIDYIRPFDLTKRAESWLKEAVGGGQEPTIITPSAYRSRFLNFMDAIICLSPSPWLDPNWQSGPILVAQMGKEGGKDQMAPAPQL